MTRALALATRRPHRGGALHGTLAERSPADAAISRLIHPPCRQYCVRACGDLPCLRHRSPSSPAMVHWAPCTGGRVGAWWSNPLNLLGEPLNEKPDDIGDQHGGRQCHPGHHGACCVQFVLSDPDGAHARRCVARKRSGVVRGWRRVRGGCGGGADSRPPGEIAALPGPPGGPDRNVVPPDTLDVASS
jgi:hypothetical protein